MCLLGKDLRSTPGTRWQRILHWHTFGEGSAFSVRRRGCAWLPRSLGGLRRCCIPDATAHSTTDSGKIEETTGEALCLWSALRPTYRPAILHVGCLMLLCRADVSDFEIGRRMGIGALWVGRMLTFVPYVSSFNFLAARSPISCPQPEAFLPADSDPSGPPQHHSSYSRVLLSPSHTPPPWPHTL